MLDHLDNALDARRDVEQEKETYKTPYVRNILTALIVLMFLIFILLASSFVFEIPILHNDLVQHFTSAVVEIIKLFTM